MNWQVPEVYPCSVLAREVGGVGPFISPSADPAPWYNAAISESAEFLGLVSKLDFQTLTVKRNTTQRFGSIGGGVIGIEQLAVRGLHVDGMLIASSCAGLEYGRHWLYSKLGSDCLGCGLRTVRVRDSCPPADGSNDPRGERILYDAALIEGIQRTDDGGANCCDYDGIAFSLASQSPYLYGRSASVLAATEAQSSEGVLPLLPAILDTFVRANTGPPPSASWTGVPITGYTNNLRVLSNQLDNASTTLQAGAYWNVSAFGPDCIVTVVVPTRVANGQFRLFARLTTPGLGTGQGVSAMIRFGASTGTDMVQIGRERSVSTQLSFTVQTPSNLTLASGDTFALTCRGHLLELWRLPSGGAWTRLIATYDSIGTPVTGNAGLSIDSFNGVGQHLGAFGAGPLAVNGSAYPHDVVTVPIAAVPVGVTSPIVTVKAPGTANGPSGFIWDNPSVSGVRIQMKKGLAGECFQSDDFAADDLATRWTVTASSFAITGGKLKPTATGTSGGLGRTARRRLATGAAVALLGGRVEATIKTGASVTNGVWGVTMGLNIGAYLVKAVGAFSNVFMLNNSSNGAGGLDSVAFTPLTGTTYRIILELLPTATAGQYTAIAYLVDATNAMLTRPLLATVGTLNALGPTFQPSIDTIPAGTDEEWDSFYAIDYTDEASYINVAIPPGTLTLDASRRVSQFVSAASNAQSVEGSPYLSSPIDTPLGWPDLCAGEGPGCLQLWAEEGSFPGGTVAVSLQNRQR